MLPFQSHQGGITRRLLSPYNMWDVQVHFGTPSPLVCHPNPADLFLRRRLQVQREGMHHASCRRQRFPCWLSAGQALVFPLLVPCRRCPTRFDPRERQAEFFLTCFLHFDLLWEGLITDSHSNYYHKLSLSLTFIEVSGTVYPVFWCQHPSPCNLDWNNARLPFLPRPPYFILLLARLTLLDPRRPLPLSSSLFAFVLIRLHRQSSTTKSTHKHLSREI